MSGISRVSEYMTPSPISIDAEADAAIARALMLANGFRHLPVTREGKTIGIVSERDLGSAGRLADPGIDAIRVGDVAKFDLYRVSPATPLDEVVRVMEDRRVDSAVVLDGDALVGIFTMTDALRALRALLGKT